MMEIFESFRSFNLDLAKGSHEKMPFFFLNVTLHHDIDNGNSVHAVFLDLSEAFDKLSLEFFLDKLYSLSCCHSAVKKSRVPCERDYSKLN